MHPVLDQQFKNQKLSHAYIFEAQTDQASQMVLGFCKRLFANQVNEQNEHDFSQFVDVDLIAAEKNNINIDQIRELKKRIYERPSQSDYKIYVIEQAHLMRSEAQNALLKTLEEAPSYVILILTTDNRNKLYDTILSRCQVVSNYMDEGLSITEGQLFDLLELMKKAINMQYYAILSSKTFFDKFLDQKSALIGSWQRIFYDILKYKLGIRTSAAYDQKLSVFESLSFHKIEKMILDLEKVNEEMKVNVNFQLAMERMLFALSEA